jgi:gas vesicle protein
MSNDSNLSAFLLGAIAGGVTALLFAPMSGERLRGRIAERGEELKQRTAESAHTAAEKARGALEGARDVASKKAAAVTEAVEEGKAAYKRELEKAKAS